MSHEIVPLEDTPSDDERHEQPRDDATQNGNRQRHRRYVYSEDECLQMLTQLPGMLKAKLITPSEANAIRSVLQAILAAHQTNRPTYGSQKEIPPSILNIVREHPELQTWFEPFLSDADIDSLMRGDGQ